LLLAAWRLKLEAFKKLFTAALVACWQRAMVISKPWQQIIFFNSLHNILSSLE